MTSRLSKSAPAQTPQVETELQARVADYASNADRLAQLETEGKIPRPMPRPERFAQLAYEDDDNGKVRPKARPEPTEYVDSTKRQKASQLAKLFGENEDLLKANGVSNQMEITLAGTMLSEGGRNEARRILGEGYAADTKRLIGNLGDKGVNDLTDEQVEALPEDQRWLLEAARRGEIDLEATRSKDEATRESALEKVTESGIAHRKSQYEEMSALMARDDLSKEEKARLSQLQQNKGLGLNTRMGDLAGMSGDRFAEIYQEGQQRFEPYQYKRLRKTYMQSLAKQEQNPDRDLSMSSGIGKFDVTPEMKASLDGNHDLIADMATSYGTAQIMGAYAQAGLLEGVDAQGNADPITLAELKASKDRLSPNADDLEQQMAFMRMKGINMGRNLSTSQMAIKYNGARSGTRDHQIYRDKLSTGRALYERAQRNG